MVLPTVEQLQEEINHLLEEMAQPRVSLDPNKMKELTASHKQKEGLLKLLQELGKIEGEIAATDKLSATETDAELRQMAEEDAIALREKQQQTQSQIV